MLGLCCCAQSFSSHERGLFLVAVPELLIEKLLLRSTGSRYTGFSSCHVQALESAGFSSCHVQALGTQASAVAMCRLWRVQASAVVTHGLSCSSTCGIFPDQGSNPCPLHWQANFYPLYPQGMSKTIFFLKRTFRLTIKLWRAFRDFPRTPTSTYP